MAHQGCCSGGGCSTDVSVDPNQSLETKTQAVAATGDTPVVLTAKAIEMVKKALAEEGLENHGLRVAVRGGGCSGLEYSLDFADASRPGDAIHTFDGLKVYIDMASAQYLNGTEIDYVTGLQGQGFKFNNPNAVRSCGCGHSFSA